MKISQAFKNIFTPRKYQIKPHCLHDWQAKEKAATEQEELEYWEYLRNLAKGIKSEVVE